MHESFEAPAAIEKWLQNNGHQIEYTKIYNGDTFPGVVDDIDFLFVMGGPQSPATTVEECPYFDVKKEISFIKKIIDAEKPVVGVCLGAQLIGESLGAKFEHSPSREIGVFGLTLTDAGKKDSIFSKFPEKFMVGHWHGDMPGLTEDSEVLAYSEGCPRQIVRYRQKVYGLQCHLQFNSEAVEGMIENCSDELEKYSSHPYIQGAEKLRNNDYHKMNSLLYKLLDYMETL